MFELIIFIIIITAVVNKSKKKNAGKPSEKQSYSAVSRPQQKRPAAGRPVQKPAQKPVQKPVQKKPEEMSTTEMLEAKALADDREEMMEKQRQRMENKKHYGHHNYAERYVLGDSVAKGKKMVFCSYCNAENLIPAHKSAKEYNCYFCREKL